MQIDFDEGERQAMLLALAQLELDRPGWSYAIGEMVGKFEAAQPGSTAMFEEFKRLNEDRFAQLPGLGGARGRD